MRNQMHHIMNYYETFPKPIIPFYFLYNHLRINKLKENHIAELQKISKGIMQYLNETYNRWFPNSKRLNEDYYLEHIFSITFQNFQQRQFGKIHFCSLINTYGYLLQDLDLAIEDYESFQNSTEIHKELATIKIFLDSYMLFHSQLRSLFETDLPMLICSSELPTFSSFECYIRSTQLLKGSITNCVRIRNKENNSYNEISALDNSYFSTVVFLRQSIELFCFEVLGVKSIKKDGEFMKISGFAFIDLFEKNQEKVKIPIKISILKKIYAWSNFHIHGGHTDYYWTIYLAWETISKIFNKDDVTVRNAEIDLEFYQNRELIIKEFLGDNQIEIEFSDFNKYQILQK